MINFLELNTQTLIAFWLMVIGIALVYIAFFKDTPKKNHGKHRGK